MTDKLTFTTRTGPETASVFEDLAKLRIAVFKSYPYLYEGSVAYEMDYLKIYAKSERSLLFAVYDGSEMVGATTCISLTDETPEVRRPFEEAGLDVSSIFYFGESILLPAYRGLGLGHRFFDEREAHARSFGTYKLMCFCSVDRGEHHPKKPADYRSNDIFWQKRGYTEAPDLRAAMDWPDIGETESSSKPMVFWIKTID